MYSNHCAAPKIGVFYDGNFLLHASNYYNYIHPQRRRLCLNGLHDFICQRVAEEEGIDPKRCRVNEAHYFRGRLNASDAAQRGSQLYHDRVFDDILMSEGVHPHYLPLRNIYGRKEERGTDVWLALEVYEMALRGKIDIAVLVVADTDYVPLVRKLIALGVRVMLISWEFEYINDEGNRIVTKTSHELLNLAHYPVPMQEVIDCGLKQNNQLIMNLFVSNDAKSQGGDAAEEGGKEADETVVEAEDEFTPPGRVGREPGARYTSTILSIKTGYGFIKYPNNNLFFHRSKAISRRWRRGTRWSSRSTRTIRDRTWPNRSNASAGVDSGRSTSFFEPVCNCRFLSRKRQCCYILSRMPPPTTQSFR